MVAQTLPGVRLIALLRDPVARAFSHYQWTKSRGYEALAFEEALSVEEEMDPEIKAQLESYFQPHNEKLLEVSGWKQGWS